MVYFTVCVYVKVTARASAASSLVTATARACRLLVAVKNSTQVV